MSALHAVLNAVGAPLGAVDVLKEDAELGTLVAVGGQTLLVSPPYDPDATGIVSLRAVGPPPPALPTRAHILVAHLPS
jgi:hypothetical protein